MNTFNESLTERKADLFKLILATHNYVDETSAPLGEIDYSLYLYLSEARIICITTYKTYTFSKWGGTEHDVFLNWIYNIIMYSYKPTCVYAALHKIGV